MPKPRRSTLLAAFALLLAGCTEIRTPGFESLSAAPAQEQSVAPGINDAYLAADIDVGQWQQRFEVESREIYHERGAIVRAVGLRRGEAIADVGGTGLFLEAFAEAVGPSGKVYELDIVPAFVDHMNERAATKGLSQVEARLCSERSIGLPADSIDTAFACDVYHHFEYPQSSLASIYSALRPGGQFVVIDFERLPGVSREWVLNHVRAGKGEVTAEVLAAGFRLAEEVEIEGFQESYFLRFRKPR